MRRAGIAVWLAALVACDSGGPSDPADDAAPTSLQLDLTSIDVFATEARKVNATVLDRRGQPLSSRVTWTSNNPSIAEVDSTGRVQGVAAGNTVIEARIATLKATATVLVRPLLGFAMPLQGELNRDFYYTNYVDLLPGPGIQDYRCGLKTYDGHQGVDIVLPSFARMDEGVQVLATAPGTVIVVQDGLQDRNKTWANGGGFANHVVIEHRDGFRSYYGHMRRNSIQVQPGQQVQTGTVLGLVGSSGTSDMPHLHIEYRRNGIPVELHPGPCGPSFTHYAAAPAYQDQFRLIQSGTTNADMTLDLAKDPPAQVDTFRTSDARLFFWVHLHNLPSAATSRFELYDPAGNLFASGQLAHPQFYSMSWWWFFQTIPGRITPGRWSIKYYVNNQLTVERSIVVIPGAVTSMQALPGGPASGTGGGGLHR